MDEFWGRAMGWYAMALVDVLEHLPEKHAKRAKTSNRAKSKQAAVKRKRVRRRMSLRKGKRVIPAIIDATADRPLYLEHLNYRTFIDPTDFDVSFDELRRDVEIAPPAQPLPSDLARTEVWAPYAVTPSIANAAPRPARQSIISRQSHENN